MKNCTEYYILKYFYINLKRPEMCSGLTRSITSKLSYVASQQSSLHNYGKPDSRTSRHTITFSPYDLYFLDLRLLSRHAITFLDRQFIDLDYRFTFLE